MRLGNTWVGTKPPHIIHNGRCFCYQLYYTKAGRVADPDTIYIPLWRMWRADWRRASNVPMLTVALVLLTVVGGK